MEALVARLANLLSVKSLVTLILTIVWAVLLCTGQPIPEMFITIYTVVVSFYFGTQSQKISEAISKNEQASKESDLSGVDANPD